MPFPSLDDIPPSLAFGQALMAAAYRARDAIGTKCVRDFPVGTERVNATDIFLCAPARVASGSFDVLLAERVSVETR